MPSSGGATEWVGVGQEAMAGHGASPECRVGIGMSEQSVLSFSPGNIGNMTLGTSTSLGSITHYNKSVETHSRYFRGLIEVQTTGLLDEHGTPVVFSFPWFMDETPNDCTSSPTCSDDFTLITVQSSETVVYVEGKPYKMVIRGFGNPHTGTLNQWWTPEWRTTTTTMVGALEQVRDIKVEKKVETPLGWPVPSGFTFTSKSSLTGSPWATNFTLAGKATYGPKAVSVPSEKVTIQETVPSGWQAPEVSCVGVNVGTKLVKNGIEIEAREVTELAQVPITCTFVNRPIVQPLTVTKQVSELAYTPSYDWDIVKTVSPADSLANPRPSGTTFDWAVTASPTPVKRNATFQADITITNPNPVPITGINVSDAGCTVAPAQNLTVDSKTSKTVKLDCATSVVEATANPATISWPAGVFPVAGSATSNAAAFSFSSATVGAATNETVHITDTNAAFAATYSDSTVNAASGAKTFTYSTELTSAEGTCQQYDNTATITETGATASASAKVCKPAKKILKQTGTNVSEVGLIGLAMVVLTGVTFLFIARRRSQ